MPNTLFTRGEKNMSKICPQCGKELADTAAFCNQCGTKMDGVASTSENTQSVYAQVQPNQSSVKNSGKQNGLVIDSSEKVIAELKNSVAQNVIAGNGLSKNTTFFTDQRLYYQSKRLSWKAMGKITNDFVVDLKEVSATNVVNRNPIIFLVIAIIVTIILVLMTAQETVLGAFGVLILLAIVVALIYSIAKDTYIQLSFPGGTARLSVKMYNYSDVLKFHKMLRQYIEKSR